MNKKAAIGEWTGNIFKIFVISVTALLIFGASSTAYAYQIDVRNAEAVIMIRQIIECISYDGQINLDKANFEEEGIFSSCFNYGSVEERFFVRINLLNREGKLIKSFKDGDEGALWVKNLFDKTNLKDSSTTIQKYRPGYSIQRFPARFISDFSELNGFVEIEVLVRNEEK